MLVYGVLTLTMGNPYKAEHAKIESFAHELQMVAEANGEEPSLESLIASLTANVTEEAKEVALEVTKDTWGNPYKIEKENGTVIRSAGADGEMGNEDDLTISLETMEVKVDENLLKDGVGGMTYLTIGLIVVAVACTVVALKLRNSN